MDKVTIVIKYKKDYAEYRYILTKIDEIADEIENLQAKLIAIKGFVMAQIYLNSEYDDD